MKTYIPVEFPKHLPEYDIDVANAAEEAAVRNGTAVIQVTKTAQGDQRKVVGIKKS
jgi:hypothetical protein